MLLDDCLTSYCEPQVNRAAVEVLEAAGFEVQLAGLSCCGRPHLSKGLLNEAKTLAEENVAKLFGWAEHNIPILGCEPSCLLTLVDEYPELVPGDAAKQVAASARLIDSFLIERQVKLPFMARRKPKSILLHAHCHQKALVGAQDTLAALRLVPGYEVQLVDSGCCGMAGSFGYEHYDLSMQIGGRVLFPAVDNFDGAAVVAPGFSCRHQIADGTQRLATHPIQQLAMQLEPSADDH